MDDVLDSAAIDQLVNCVGGGDSTVFRDVAGMFIRLGPLKAAEMRRGFELGDEKALAHATHFLKGSAGTLGVWRVRADCQRIESSNLTDHVEEIRVLIDEVEQHLAEGIGALRDLLSVQGKRA